MTRASQAKEFPNKVEKAVPELFERQPSVKITDLPPDLQEMFASHYQEQINKRFKPN